MSNQEYTTVEDAMQAFSDTPSYFQWYQTTVESEGQQPRTDNWLFCLSCGLFVEDESHQCERRAA